LGHHLKRNLKEAQCEDISTGNIRRLLWDRPPGWGTTVRKRIKVKSLLPGTYVYASRWKDLYVPPVIKHLDG